MEELVNFFGDASDGEEDSAEETPFCKWRQRIQSSGAESSLSGLPSVSRHDLTSPLSKPAAVRPNHLNTSSSKVNNNKGKSSKCYTPSRSKSKSVNFKEKPMRNSISCVNLQARSGGIGNPVPSALCTTPEMPYVLPPEVEEGNIEYKRKLVNPSSDRFEHLVTQMKWRLAEGSGEAIYELGVTDDGRLAGLKPDELKDSLSTLARMARKLDASISLLRERRLPDAPERRAVEILVRRLPHYQTTQDIRVAVLGNVDAGKSTLLGVLTQSELDNGRGRARLNLLRHLHEIQSGRTSSISCELLGFDSAGRTVNYSDNRSVEEIVSASEKLVVLIDLAGHHKYQRTTLFGLTSHMPHCAALIVSANKGLVGTSRDHCSIACALNVPVIVVITKVDIASPEMAIGQVETWLQSLGVTQPPLRVLTEEDAATAASTLQSDRMTPIFTVSCVTGQGLPTLIRFLSLLPSPPATASEPGERARILQAAPELWVGQVFTLSHVVGSVLVGMLQSGMIHEGDALQLGPLQDGRFLPVIVTSLHRNRMPHRSVQAGQTSSVAVVLDPGRPTQTEDWPDLRRVARRGMVLLATPPSSLTGATIEGEGGVCLRLEADVTLLRGSGPLTKGSQTVLHCANVCQPVLVEEVFTDQSENAKTRVLLYFLKSPEFVRVGRTLLFRNSHNQGRGVVSAIRALDPDQAK